MFRPEYFLLGGRRAFDGYYDSGKALSTDDILLLDKLYKSNCEKNENKDKENE